MALPTPQTIAPEHGIYCNRTLNLRAIKAVGYDMDYTLIHYHMQAWESCAYEHAKARLASLGWPVADLVFDPELVMQGLIIDQHLGNVIKINRFGFVKGAMHGTHPLSFQEQRRVYKRVLVDLHEPRWVVLNTLFSISEGCLFAQCVDLMDAGKLDKVSGYERLYRVIRESINDIHMEGVLKQQIVDDPEQYVDLDPEMPLALLDQKQSGKKVLLITNSEWSYAHPMLTYVFDRYLPGKMTWKDLFDLTIFGARKPDFFSSRSPAFRIVSEDGLLREQVGTLELGKAYVGGNAALVEQSLGISGEDILYVGDHIFSDVRMSKRVQRWRTALIIRELEDELEALTTFRDQQAKLDRLTQEKEALEAAFSALRLERLRNAKGYGPQTTRPNTELDASILALRNQLLALDAALGELAGASSQLMNPNWGLLLRAGIDKSHLADQIERSADIYTGRVSNFLHYTPYVYLRSHRGLFPHDSLIEEQRPC